MEEHPNRVKCDLCHEGLTRPIMLQCSDVFCLACLQSYADKYTYYEAPTGNLKCPVCPRMFNRHEIKSMGVINEGPACAICSDEIGGKIEIAGWLCLICDKALCEKDYLNHYQRVGSESHVVVSFDVATQFSNIIDTAPTESEQLLIGAKLCDVEARFTANCTEVLNQIMLRFNALLDQIHLEKSKLDKSVNWTRVDVKEQLKSATQEALQKDSMLCTIKSNRDILTREQLHQVVNCDIESARRNLSEKLKYVPELKFSTMLVERSIMFGWVSEIKEACEPTLDQFSDVQTQPPSLEKNRAMLTYPELMNQISSVWQRLAPQTPNANSIIPPVGSEPTARNAFDPSVEINQAQDVGERSMAKQFPYASPWLASQAPSNPNFNLSNVGPEQIPRIKQLANDYYDHDLEISQYLESREHLLASKVIPSPALTYKNIEIQTVGSNQTANNAFDQIPQLDAQDASQGFMANQLSSASSPFDSQTPSNDNYKMPDGSGQTARNAFDTSADINQASDFGERSMANHFPSAYPGLAYQAPSTPNFNLSNVGPEQQTEIYKDRVTQIHQDKTNRQRFPTSELSSASPGLASQTPSNANYKIPGIEPPANDIFDPKSETPSTASSRLDFQTPSKDNYRMPPGGSEQTANNVFDPKPEIAQDLETMKRFLASNLSSAGPGLASKTPPNKNNRIQTVGSIQSPNSAFAPVPQIKAQDVSQRFMANQLSSASSLFDSSNDNNKMPSVGSERTSNNAFNPSAQMDIQDLYHRFMANQSLSASQIPSNTHPNSSPSGYERSVNTAFGLMPQINPNEEMLRRMVSAMRQVPPPQLTQRPGQVAFGGHYQGPNIQLHPQNVVPLQPFKVDPLMVLQIQEFLRVNQQKKNMALNVMASPYFPRGYLQTPMMSNAASNHEEGASQWNQRQFHPMESAGGSKSQAISVDQLQDLICQNQTAPRGRALVRQSNQLPLGQAASNSVNESERGQSFEEITTPGKKDKKKSPSTHGRGTTKSLPQNQQPKQ